MANEEMKILQESFPMASGDGPHSYAQNSVHQRSVIDSAKVLISEGVIDKLDFNDLTFRIADFGCSIGPNTYFAVENIINAVEQKYRNQIQNLEFQVFFNDLMDNDFNTLFKILPSYGQNYFAAGVAGDFHGRLFPKSTLHFGFSSYALHWLSRIPDEVVDAKSPAWNRDSIYCRGLANEVTKVYSAQFRVDMESFLSARAQEIVVGGLMVILIAVLPGGIIMSHTHAGMLHELLGCSLFDLAKLGVIGEEKVESLNLPLYFSSPKELEDIIKRNQCFSIERIEMFEHPTTKNKVSKAEYVALHFRAIYEKHLKKHFGCDSIMIDKIFECYENKLRDNPFVFDKVCNETTNIFILLKRQ